MSRASQLVTKIMKHHDLGKVKVTGVVQGSRTKVEIIVLQRAKGWDETTQTYKPVKEFRPVLDKSGKDTGRKSFHQKTYSDRHSQYGHEDVCHINELEPLNQ